MLLVISTLMGVAAAKSPGTDPWLVLRLANTAVVPDAALQN
jgi:hypothetical protein